MADTLYLLDDNSVPNNLPQNLPISEKSVVVLISAIPENIQKLYSYVELHFEHSNIRIFKEGRPLSTPSSVSPQPIGIDELMTLFCKFTKVLQL